MLNIAVCTDDKYLIPAFVCIASIFESNKTEDIKITVLTNSLSEKSTDKLKRLSETYGKPIIIKEIDDTGLKSLKTFDRFPTSMYYRFLLPEILTEEDSVLYLDCDIIVRHSLCDLFDTDLTGKACGVVIDQCCNDIRINNRLQNDCLYFNSGVLLMNLNYWRENSVKERLVEYIIKNDEILLYPDQDALNFVLRDEVTYVDLRYNYQTLWVKNLKRALIDRKYWDIIIEKGKDPAIIHFSDSFKPWYKECDNRYKDEFLGLVRKFPYLNFKLTSKYGSKKQLLINRLKKLIH